MHRFFVNQDAPRGEILRFSPEASRQMARVLRLEPGARVIAVDPEGWELTVELTRVSAHGAAGRVVGRERRATEPSVRVVLAQGLPKGDKMDFIVQKATEVGVAEILPVVTRRTVVNPAGKEEARRERWQRIAREAAEQSGRTEAPAVAPISGLAGALARLAAVDLFLVPWEEERSQTLKAALRGALRGAAPAGLGADRSASLAAANKDQERERGGFAVAVLIGPEGGLAPEEVALARAAGAVPVTLGPRLLRTETAGPITAALILYELGDLG